MEIIEILDSEDELLLKKRKKNKFFQNNTNSENNNNSKELDINNDPSIEEDQLCENINKSFVTSRNRKRRKGPLNQYINNSSLALNSDSELENDFSYKESIKKSRDTKRSKPSNYLNDNNRNKPYTNQPSIVAALKSKPQSKRIPEEDHKKINNEIIKQSSGRLNSNIEEIDDFYDNDNVEDDNNGDVDMDVKFIQSRRLRNKHRSKNNKKLHNNENNQASKVRLLPSNPGEWISTYSPSDLKDCCVHKKKIEEIRQWIHNSINNFKLSGSSANNNQHHSRLLILTGPSGSCKSTLIRLIAKSLQLNLKQFEIAPYSSSNSNVTDYISDYANLLDNNSIVAQFNDFLLRSSKYTTLSQDESEIKDKQNSVIFIDDLPFYPADYDISKQLNIKLQSLLLKAIHHTTCPIIIEITSNEERINIKHLIQLLSNDIVNSSFTHIIHCNPVNLTELKRGIGLIQMQTNIKFQASLIDKVIFDCSGDLRNAIQQLQFYHKSSNINRINNNGNTHINSNNSNKAVIKQVKKLSATSRNQLKSLAINQNNDHKDKDNSTHISSDIEDLTMCRDLNYGLFHSLGRILYGKCDFNSIENILLTESAEPHFLTEYIYCNALNFLQKTKTNNSNYNNNNSNYNITPSEDSLLLYYSDFLDSVSECDILNHHYTCNSFSDTINLSIDNTVSPIITSMKYTEIYNNCRIANNKSAELPSGSLSNNSYNSFKSFLVPESSRINRISQQKKENWFYVIKQLSDYINDPLRNNYNQNSVFNNNLIDLNKELLNIQISRSLLLEIIPFLKLLFTTSTSNIQCNSKYVNNTIFTESNISQLFCLFNDYSSGDQIRKFSEYFSPISNIQQINIRHSTKNYITNIAAETDLVDEIED